MHFPHRTIHAVPPSGLLGMPGLVWLALSVLGAVFAVAVVRAIRYRTERAMHLAGVSGMFIVGLVAITRVWAMTTVPTATAAVPLGTVDTALLAQLNAQRTATGFRSVTDPLGPSLPRTVALRDMVTHTYTMAGPWHMLSFALAPASWHWADYGSHSAWAQDFHAMASQDVAVVVQQWHANASNPAAMYQDPELGVTVIPLAAREAHGLYSAVPTSGYPGLYNANASWRHMAVYVLWGRSGQSSTAGTHN